MERSLACVCPHSRWHSPWGHCHGSTSFKSQHPVAPSLKFSPEQIIYFFFTVSASFPTADLVPCPSFCPLALRATFSARARAEGVCFQRSELPVSTISPPSPVLSLPARKRQLSPQSKSSSKVTSVPGKAAEPGPAGAKAGKSSTLSRREELLKQLKAVEDAIARKRAKIPGKV